MRESRFVKAEVTNGRCGVSTTDNGECGSFAHCACDCLCSLCECGELEDAHGAVPHNGLCRSNCLRENLAGLRADVEAHLICRNRVSTHNGCGCVCCKLRSYNSVDRQKKFDAVLLCGLHVTLHGGNLVCLKKRLANFVALRCKEGVGHAATDNELIRLRKQICDHTKLVGDLRATQNDDVRTLRIINCLTQGLDLLNDQQTCCTGQKLGNVVDGGLLTVNNTETIGNKSISKRSKLRSEGFALCIVLRGLCSVEANVLEKNDFTGLCGLNCSVCSFADSIGSKSDLDTGQLSKAAGNGCK